MLLLDCYPEKCEVMYKYSGWGMKSNVRVKLAEEMKEGRWREVTKRQ